MKKIFILFLLFSYHLTTFTHAATAPSGGGWNPKTVTRVGLDDIIEATARQQTIRNGSSVTLEAVVRETVNRRAVGKVLLSRLLAGGVLVGVTQSLLDGIGWVMEDGVYVKYKTDGQSKDKPQTRIYYKNGAVYSDDYLGTFSKCNGFYSALSELESCLKSNLKTPNQDTIIKRADFDTYVSNALNRIKNSKTSMTTTISSETYFVERTGTKLKGFDVIVGIDVTIPPDQEPQKRKIVLTDDMMGDIAVGDYTDPVDSSKDKKDRIWTGVEEAYQNDPTGTGNELSNNLDDKMDAAPETPSKPSTPPQTDGEGQKHPTDKDKGTEGTTDQDKDPTTGQPTGSGSFNLPAWCLWAADQCQWHKEDKKHQEDETKVWEDEKKHRGDEKTFWQKVTDFFDWVKEEPEKDDDQEQPDIDDKGIFSKTFDYVFSLSKQCPPDIPFQFESTYISGSYSINMNWLCMIFTFLGYPLVFASHATGIWILYEAVIRKEFKW
ncbi:hypothetical protein [Acinetobacter courvalinii]|uniref:hypothetical protein n=1 Tax=Acinetobacter courvalinii TaxID=280147 RepID=UPI0002CE4609|nr:hypothetical protein [Acinetobacter courvalinii]ENX04615.1 hypothetical protein F898_03755 [Acinetobacter courvalinii]